MLGKAGIKVLFDGGIVTLTKNEVFVDKAYGQIVHPRALTKGQLVLKVAKHVRKNVPGPSKFAPKWEGPYIIRQAHDSGYYYLTKEDGTILTDPINGKWLK